MDPITLTCPHCGFSKSVDRAKVPATARSIKCPNCRESFPFTTGTEASPDREGPAEQAEQNADFSPTDFKFCATCGHRIHMLAELCPKCGVRVAPPRNAINKVALLVITFFLGGFGGHKFYQKRYGLGALYLLFFWTYIPTLVSWVEFFIYAFKDEAELQRAYPESSGAAAILAVVVPFFAVAIIGILAAIAIPQFAAYRERAYQAAAMNALEGCRVRTETYFSQHGRYPAREEQMQCEVAPGVALYYHRSGPEEYQLISFHTQGRTAYLADSSSPQVLEECKSDVTDRLGRTFGTAALDPAFHFIE